MAQKKERDGPMDDSQNGQTPAPRRIIAICGIASSSAHLINEQPDGVELWGSSQTYGVVRRRIDRWFEIHDPGAWRGASASNRSQLRDPGRYGWLQQEKPFPIYMLEEYSDVPNSVAYPFQDLAQFYTQWAARALDGNDIIEPYLTSSIAYMLALAVYERPDEIRLLGIDMAAATEYVEQRACLEYYIGVADGLGITVAIPDVSPILKDRLYGGPREFSEAVLQHRRRDLVKERERLAAQLNWVAGQIDDCDYWLQAFGKARIMNPLSIKQLNSPKGHEFAVSRLMVGTNRERGGQPVVTGDSDDF